MNATNDHEPPSPFELALTSLAATLEERDPGICDAWVERAESEALQAEQRRLYSEAPNPVLSANQHDAMSIARRARFVVLGAVKDGHAVAKPEKRKRGGR